MENDHLALLQAFQSVITAAENGAVIPAVSEHDLRRLHELCVDRARRYCGKDGVLSIETMSQVCSPDANLPAVWLRHRELRTLYREGLLAEWQQGTNLDDVVFRFAATIPMDGIRFDPAELIRQLRSETGLHRLQMVG